MDDVADREIVTSWLAGSLSNSHEPTSNRYTLDIDLKKAVPAEVTDVKNKGKRHTARKEVRKVFEERYNSGQTKYKWFFSKLRF